MEISKKDLESIMARQADRVAKESEERMQRYIGGLNEDFGHKLDAVTEYVRDIPALKQKVDIIFEKVGEGAIEATIIKQAVTDHARRLARVEAK